MRLRRVAPLFLLLLGALTLASTHSLQSSGAVRYVNNSDLTCLNQSPCYSTIQAAVDAAQAGDTIRIQAGHYNEVVTVTGKNKARAVATEADRIIIEADPTAPTGSVVIGSSDASCTAVTAFLFASSHFVTLRGVTIRNAGAEAIRLLGANHSNTDIRIDRNRIFGNGTCPGGIVIAQGNARTVLSNNLIYGNGQNGVTFDAGQGGPHYVVGNTIHGNGHNGVSFDRLQEVWLVNNVITQNGQAGANPQGAIDDGFGGKRTSPGPQQHPQLAALLGNLICGNKSGELNGAILDSTDIGNFTPTGQEGKGVSPSPGCNNMANVFANLNGPDGTPNTDDDDFTLATGSPAIDHGIDPHTLGLGNSVDALFTADFASDTARPRDGDGDGTAAFDMGALEKQSVQCTPRKTEACYEGPPGTQGVGVCKAGTKTCQLDGKFGPCVGEVLPSIDIPNNGIDENCDGHDSVCSLGATASCYDGPSGTQGVGQCKAGTKTCGADGLFGACAGEVVPQTDIPNNGIDENCDGHDSICTPGATMSCYDGPAGTQGVGICKAGTKTCSADGTFGACQGETLPQPEIPDNGIDEDCNGSDAQVDFTLTAAPTTAEAIQGQSASYTLMVTGSAFTQLATLDLAGLPAGITGAFNTSYVAAGQTALLTVSVANDQPPGSASFIASASARVNGKNVTHSVSLTLQVLRVTTSFVGRTVVADDLQTPLAHVTVSLLGLDGKGSATGCTAPPTVSDAAGNFMFTDLPPECAGGQLIRYDGTTTSPLVKHAGVDLFYDIKPNQVTTSPVLIHLPRIDDKEAVCVQQNAPQDKTVTFASIPNMTVTVYAGTTFTPHPQYPPRPNACDPGFFALIAIDVPVDRLPDEMPPDPDHVMPFIVAFQPPNAFTNQPVAVSFPNLLNNAPGTNLTLMTLDPTKGVMVNYGTGTVSPNGTQIIPDLDPAHPGKRYGLVHFDWHGAAALPPPPANDPGPCRSGECVSIEAPEDCPYCPIDPSTGSGSIHQADSSFTGSRGTIAIERIYRTGSTQAGPFGIGGRHNYGYMLATNTPVGTLLINLVMPDGNQFPFVRQQDGTLINTTSPSLRGAVMSTPANGQPSLRWKDGTTFHFQTRGFDIGLSASTLESITDVNGNTITLVRDAARPIRINEVVDPVGRKLTLSYDNANRITSIADPLGHTVQYTYNAQGALETITNAEGGVTRYDYDSDNNVTRIIDPRGVVRVENTYVAGKVVEQKQADSGGLSFIYQLEGAPCVVKDRWFLFQTCNANSPVRQTTVIDSLGRITSYRFDQQGFLLSVTDPFGQTRSLEREPGTNLVLSVKGTASCSACGASSAGDESFTYDANGNMLTRTDALGKVTHFTYEPQFNRVTSVTNPLGQTTTLEYDALGNLTAATDGNGHTTRLTYGAAGLLTKVTDPLNHEMSVTYDGFGNPLTLTDPLGRTTSLNYDADSRLLSLTDPLGRTSSATYDGLDRILTATDANNNTTQFTYDAVGNLLSLTDAQGRTTAFTYDAMNRLLTKKTPSGKMDSRQYDLNGNLTKFTDRRGQAATFAYDQLDRPIHETYQDSTVDLTYDPRGRLLRVDDSLGGVFTFIYDLVGRQLSAAGPTGTVQYQRDDLGRVISRQVAGQSPVAYTYDAAGNLLAAAAPEASVSFTYDPRNLLLSQIRSNGVTSTYAYDALGQVLSLKHTKGATVLNAQTYSYDEVGSRNSYDTDIAQALTTPAVTAEYDAENRLLRRGAFTYTYDENGNRTSQTGPAGTTTYTWDARNRLRSMTTPTGQTATFHYDFAWNLLAKDTSGPGGGTETYVLDNLTNVVSQSTINGQSSSILTGRSIDSHLAVIPPNGQAAFGLGDALNSTVAATDQNGATTGQFFYEPYGETTTEGNPYPFQYTGRTPAPDGLYNYRARFYDPQAGRFISEDPIGFGGGDVNLYAYTLNIPSNLIDPYGLSDSSTMDQMIGWDESLYMGLQWLTGTGPKQRSFGPNSRQARFMRSSWGVNETRRLFYAQGCSSYHGWVNFGIQGFFRSGFNPTEQFVGGYEIRVLPNPDNGRTATFIITNHTNIASAIPHLKGFRPGSLLQGSIFSDVSQTITWTENIEQCACGH